MIRGSLFTLWLLVVSAAQAQPVIVVLGDSLSSGYGLSEGESWVDLLQERLQRLGYPHRVVNASVSGDTSAGGLVRFEAAVARHRPSHVIIELGGNDGLRALSLTALRNNLIAIIELAREHGAQVVLAGMRLPPNYGPAYTQSFADIYHEIASAYDVALIPFFMQGVATVPGMMQADRVHPAVTAQPVLLENVWPYIQPLL